MPKTVRGANSERRVKLQKQHDFHMTREEAEEANKDDLLRKADELGVIGDIPANGSSDVPLKPDLVDHLVELSNKTQS